MNNLELPRFNIPASCDSLCRRVSLEQYHEWVQENIERLQEKGLYDQYRKSLLRMPANTRFQLYAK